MEVGTPRATAQAGERGCEPRAHAGCEFVYRRDVETDAQQTVASFERELATWLDAEEAPDPSDTAAWTRRRISAIRSAAVGPRGAASTGGSVGSAAASAAASPTQAATPAVVPACFATAPA